jgi:hypothetical protein
MFMKETMTVHEALCEMKILNKRISKALDDFKPVAVKEHCASLINGKPAEEFVAAARASYQSVTDMIKRMNAIKTAVNQYNAEKHIIVCGKDYTVAQAIYMMSSGMSYQRELISGISAALNLATSAAVRQNGDSLNERAQNAMNAIYGPKDKSDPEAYLNGLKQYKEQHAIEIVDPLNAAKIIQELTKEMDDFDAHVDSAIQTANATSVIEIEY